MRSNDSSVDDECAQCRHHRRYHDGDLCTVCPGFTGDNHHAFVFTEPKGSTNSSPDDKCTCGCTRTAHMGRPYGCLVHGFHAFAPAEPEAHEHDWTDWGAVYHGGDLQWRDCRGCKHTEARTEGHSCPECDPEPEAWSCMHTREGGCCNSKPDCTHGCQKAAEGLTHMMTGVTKAETCAGCEHLSHGDAPCLLCLCGHSVPEPEATVCTHDHWDKDFMRCQDCGFEPESPGSSAPPRPPFLVAYATGSGALNELALPGEASVAVVDGSLVISHASGVLGIASVKPLEVQ